MLGGVPYITAWKESPKKINMEQRYQLCKMGIIMRQLINQNPILGGNKKILITTSTIIHL